jgi:hypothetical protein
MFISFYYGKGINFAGLVLDGIRNLVYHFGILWKYMNYFTQNILVSIHETNQLKSKQNIPQCSKSHPLYEHKHTNIVNQFNNLLAVDMLCQNSVIFIRTFLGNIVTCVHIQFIFFFFFSFSTTTTMMTTTTTIIIMNYRKLPYWALHTYFRKCWCRSTLEPMQELVIWAPYTVATE